MQIRGLRRRAERGPGQSLVEFALILPVFLVILSAAVDLGRLAYARVTIANVAREASFQAAQTPTSYQAGQPCSSADPNANLVICRAILESAGSPVTVTPADIALTCSPSCAGEMGNTVTVKVTGHFNLVTQVIAAFFGSTTFDFSSSSTNQISALPTPGPLMPTPDPTAAPTATPVPTATPAPTSPACVLPSAGFTYTRIDTPAGSGRSPVTVSVTDTSTSSAACPILSWAWDWGDGVTSYNPPAPVTHTYFWPGPAATKTFSLTLTVTNSSGSNTSGVTLITVRKP